MKFDLVAEGGGAKIGGHVGAYCAALNRGFTLSHAAGSSSGAIVAAMAVAGYGPAEMHNLLLTTDFTKFLDGSKWKPKRIWDLISNLGMHNGDEFYRWIKAALAEKDIHTFKNLLSDNIDDLDIPKYRWRLKVTASDVTNGRLLTFPDDAALFGIEPDDMEVALAIRMSMSIPLFFKPILIKGTNGRADTKIVDGGLLSNFPIWMFDSDVIPPWPTFGFLLKEDDFGRPTSTDGLADFLLAIIKTMLNAHDRKFVRPEDYIHRTIAVPTGNVTTTKFDLSIQEKEMLYHNGHRAMNQFLESWSFAKYKNWSKKIRGIR